MAYFSSAIPLSDQFSRSRTLPYTARQLSEVSVMSLLFHIFAFDGVIIAPGEKKVNL